jgi:hypothetical protein
MRLNEAKHGHWVRVTGSWWNDLPVGTRILRTTNKYTYLEILGVTEDGGLVVTGIEVEVEYDNDEDTVTFGDLSPGEMFTLGDEEVFQKLGGDKYIANDANCPADGIAIDTNTLEPFNFDNDDEVERA